jgi:hypothetical protein
LTGFFNFTPSLSIKISIVYLSKQQRLLSNPFLVTMHDLTSYDRLLYKVNVQALRIFVIQSRTTTVIQYYLIASVIMSTTAGVRTGDLLLFVLPVFFHPIHYSVPSFLNVTVLHYNVFTKAVHNKTSSWLLVG